MEIIFSIISIGCIAGVYGLLSAYDGKALSEWTHAVSINTVISTIVTVLKLGLMGVLSESIAQLKWSWFYRRDRKLKDMVLFDHASRAGIGGALKMVVSIAPW